MPITYPDGTYTRRKHIDEKLDCRMRFTSGNGTQFSLMHDGKYRLIFPAIYGKRDHKITVYLDQDDLFYLKRTIKEFEKMLSVINTNENEKRKTKTTTRPKV